MGKQYDKSVTRMICGNARKTEEVKIPKYFCKNCTKCVFQPSSHLIKDENGGFYRCTFYNRPVVKDYNRCFNHSHYSPFTTAFKEPENLAELVEQEEKKVA